MHADHLEVIDRALMQCSLCAATGGAEGLSHVIFEMPPRHGKTQTISRLYPAWHLGRNPDDRVILASYGATLAYRNSRYARNLAMDERYRQVFPHVDLAKGSRAVDTWELDERYEGGMDAAGVGGGLTGKGGQIIIVDDPVKSREEAESEIYRDKVYHWFTEDLYSRREPGAAVIVVMTRWHMDDLVGRLLRDDRAKWERIRLPALAEANDTLGRAVGDPLWPARYPLDVLRDIEQTMGPYPWAALYQQNPVPAEGGVFKRAWFSLVQRMFIPGLTQLVRFWDLAMSEKTAADYTVGILMGQGDDGRIYVLDVKRIQAEWGDVVPFIAQTALEDGPSVQIGVEEAGYMSRAIQELISDGRLHHFGIWGYPVDKDKLTRALPFAARCAAGNVSVVEAHWTGTYLDEMCSFNKGAHDDQVDGSSGAYAMLDGGLFEGGLNLAQSYNVGVGDY